MTVLHPASITPLPTNKFIALNSAYRIPGNEVRSFDLEEAQDMDGAKVTDLSFLTDILST
jgi:hypothetical protein